MSTWEKAQEWEKSWWGDCVNTMGEEMKQVLYARKMGLQFFNNGKSPYNIDMKGASVLDIGGGPCSLLLKCVNVAGMVVDPLCVPQWVIDRYAAANICYHKGHAETLITGGWDEAWIYNVLPHVEDPERVVANARKAAKLVRIFDWIDTGIGAGHPISVSASQLDAWLGGQGKVELINQGRCKGKAYYGIFSGNVDGLTAIGKEPNANL